MPKMTVVIENRRLAAGRSIVSSFDVSTSPLIEIFHPFITSPSPSIDGGFYWPFGGPLEVHHSLLLHSASCRQSIIDTTLPTS